MRLARSPRGAVWVPIVCVLVGLILGLAAGIVPRLFNIDPLQWIQPQQEKKESTENDGKAAKVTVHPKELELRGLIADVKKQRALLDEREKPLAARATQLDQKNKDLEEMKSKMDEMEERIKKSTLEISVIEQKNVKRLAKMWAQMEPTEVAALVKGLDIDTAAKVLSTMQERQSAPILGAIAIAASNEKLGPDLVLKLKQIKVATDVAGGKNDLASAKKEKP